MLEMDPTDTEDWINADDPQPEFEVEKIIQRRKVRTQWQYLVKWRHWGPEHNSWEPEKNLRCSKLLEEFEEEGRKTRTQEDMPESIRRGWQGSSMANTYRPRPKAQGPMRKLTTTAAPVEEHKEAEAEDREEEHKEAEAEDGEE